MTADDAERLAVRADLCRFLAGCYYQPEAAFIEEKLFDSMREVAARIDADLAAHASRLGEAFIADDLQALLVDYTRLFLGPVDTLARPYESVWLDDGKSLMQDSTMDVLRLYGDGGFEIAEDFRDLPDHIAAELEFLYLLIHRENVAQRSGDAGALASAVQLRRRFLDEHLGRWIGPFTAAMRDAAQCDFYRRLAVLTEAVVGGEMRRAAG